MWIKRLKENSYRPEHFRCPYCWNWTYRTTGEDIYWTRKYPWFYWKCPSCPDVYVWCHKWTAIPLWKPANKELRILRNNLHAKFDLLWKEQWMWRKNAYNWLSQRMWIKFEDTHIAFFDEKQCNQALTLF